MSKRQVGVDRIVDSFHAGLSWSVSLALDQAARISIIHSFLIIEMGQPEQESFFDLPGKVTHRLKFDRPGKFSSLYVIHSMLLTSDKRLFLRDAFRLFAIHFKKKPPPRIFLFNSNQFQRLEEGDELHTIAAQYARDDDF